jgi:hypothetical protein
VVDVGRVEQIIEQLKTEPSRRSDLLNEYSALIKSGLTLEEGLCAIEAATDFPPPRDPTVDSAASLVGYLADSRFPGEHGVAAIPRILELYLALPDKARRYAVWLLMNIPEREGAEALMTLVRQYFHDGGIPDYAFNGRYTHSAHAEVYFPELLDYARLSESGNDFKIWSICLQYCEQNILKSERIISHSNVVVGEYQTLKAKMLPVQSQAGWSTNHAYLADRETAGLLLDLMRFFPTDEIKRQLSAALVEYRDPVLLCWACVTALWLKLPVDRQVIERIAASDESRKPFYGMLKKQRRSALFPKQYRTKEAFARSDLVGWLTYPTELGRVPDEIELTHTIVDENEHGIYEWFLFRFRSKTWARETNADPAKWMAGWSGPFLKDDSPGKVLTPGGTFSGFRDWDSKTPAGHIGLDDDSSGQYKVIACE